jgi:tRNA threonylcarbamoyl adenosine modification protein YeaZ
LLPTVDRALKKAGLRYDQLDAVVAASGPGRFTGIRIGLSFATIVAMRLKIPALAISRLEACAHTSPAKNILSALPGWKGEVYHQIFVRRGLRLSVLGDPSWTTPDQWPAVLKAAQDKGIIVIENDVTALDLLGPARERLKTKKIPAFEPLYLKPAGYEKKPSH